MQLIVRLPKVYYNEGNVNNRSERLMVYHNQWLYGMGFVEYLERFIKGFEYLVKKGRETAVGDYKETMKKAIGYANNSNLDYLTNTREYEDEGHDYNGDLAKSESVLNFLKSYDNNNGYIYLKVNEAGGVEYCILNGLEDADSIEIQKPKQYVNLFYEDDKITKECLEAIEILNGKQTIDAFKDLKAFRTKVIKMKENEVVERL